MPCYDKKLEASRPDFYLSQAETREVDCVITSGKEHCNGGDIEAVFLFFIYRQEAL